MVLEVSQRIRAIAESGTYNGVSLNANALNHFVGQIDSIGKPVMFLLPRGNSGWQKEAGASFYVTVMSYDMFWYIRSINDNEPLALAELEAYEELISNVYLSRPQLELSDTGLANVYGEITLQTTSNFYTPIFYPPNGVPATQGAALYWGFIMRLTVPYRKFVIFSPRG